MSEDATLGPLVNVAVGVTAELGRCTMRLRDLLELGVGGIVALDRAFGSPLDLLVNDEPIARGQLILVDDRFALQITEILGSRNASPQ